jgi:replicative DNA helicase
VSGYTAIRSTERVAGIPAKLEQAHNSKTDFGIPFLDDALTGLLPSDLMLVGAKTGRGKTALCVHLARVNAMKKKNVLFLALEAENDEIEMRLLYQIEAGLFFQDEQRDKAANVSFRNWRFGFLRESFKKYQIEAQFIFESRYKTLCTVYRQEAFTLNDLHRVIDRAKEWADLVILDHLHYIDLVNNSEVNNETSQMIKKIRSLNTFYNKPFIVAAHLRKGVDGLLPQTEDFMGSSDIGKNSTLTLMVTPRPDGYSSVNQTFSTIFSIPKSRTGGIGSTVGLLEFSLRHQMYLSNYRLANVSYKNEKVEVIDEKEYPSWAKNYKSV